MLILIDGHDSVTKGNVFIHNDKTFIEHNLVVDFNNIIEKYLEIYNIDVIRINNSYIMKYLSEKEVKPRYPLPVESIDYKVKVVNMLCKKFDNPIVIETHFNGYDGIVNGIGSGYEIFHFPTSRKGKALAEDLISMVEQTIVTFSELPNRKVKNARFRILRKVIPPALIIEPFFMDDDIEFLYDKAMFEMLAVAWGHAIQKILRS